MADTRGLVDTRVGDLVEVTAVGDNVDSRAPRVGAVYRVMSVGRTGQDGTYVCLSGCELALLTTFGDRWTVVREAT